MRAVPQAATAASTTASSFNARHRPHDLHTPARVLILSDDDDGDDDEYSISISDQRRDSTLSTHSPLIWNWTHVYALSRDPSTSAISMLVTPHTKSPTLPRATIAVAQPPRDVALCLRLLKVQPQGPHTLCVSALEDDARGRVSIACEINAPEGARWLLRQVKASTLFEYLDGTVRALLAPCSQNVDDGMLIKDEHDIAVIDPTACVLFEEAKCKAVRLVLDPVEVHYTAEAFLSCAYDRGQCLISSAVAYKQNGHDAVCAAGRAWKMGLVRARAAIVLTSVPTIERSFFNDVVPLISSLDAANALIPPWPTTCTNVQNLIDVLSSPSGTLVSRAVRVVSAARLLQRWAHGFVAERLARVWYFCPGAVGGLSFAVRRVIVKPTPVRAYVDERHWVLCVDVELGSATRGRLCVRLPAARNAPSDADATFLVDKDTVDRDRRKPVHLAVPKDIAAAHAWIVGAAERRARNHKRRRAQPLLDGGLPAASAWLADA